MARRKVRIQDAEFLYQLRTQAVYLMEAGDGLAFERVVQEWLEKNDRLPSVSESMNLLVQFCRHLGAEEALRRAGLWVSLEEMDAEPEEDRAA